MRKVILVFSPGEKERCLPRLTGAVRGYIEADMKTDGHTLILTIGGNCLEQTKPWARITMEHLRQGKKTLGNPIICDRDPHPDYGQTKPDNPIESFKHVRDIIENWIDQGTVLVLFFTSGIQDRCWMSWGLDRCFPDQPHELHEVSIRGVHTFISAEKSASRRQSSDG